MSDNFTDGGTAIASDQTVAGYTLVERLGSGGYGEVWRAAAPGGLTKAVKIVYGNFTETRGARELKALDRIKDVRHPFLLSLERIEVVDGRLVIVTELADMSLKDRFQQCRAAGLPGIPRKELVAHLRDAADALDFMNDRYSLQHMDVKPENLLIVGGRLKVADFGLVKNLHEVSVSVLDGMTPPYAPPELFNGTPSDRSDQYSLAVVYQEMLTGELPFTARTSAEWARIHIATARKPNLEPLPISERRTVDRALARLPIDRYGNCGEFVDALQGQTAVDSNPSPARARPALVSSHTSSTAHPGTEKGSDAWDRTIPISAITASAAVNVDDEPNLSSHPSGGTNTINALRSNSPIVKLPPVEFDPDLWKPRPTLVVGIGGTGAAIVSQLRRRLNQKFGRSANYPAWSALLVDVDEEQLQRAVDVEGTVLAADTLHTPLRSTAEYREESAELLRWISRRWLYNIPHTRQTQGWRPLGRLAFADNGKRLMTRVRERLDDVLATAAIDQTGQCVGRSLSPAPRIVVVASLCGGTGSGMALDAGYLLRQAIQEAGLPASHLMGLLTISAPRDNSVREQALANAYACLKELHYYTQSPRGYPGDDWSGVLPAPAGVGPFDDTYLLNLGQSLDNDQFVAQCNLAAEYLFFNQATPIGEMLDGCRQNPAPKESAGAGNLRSCRLLPLTFAESDLEASIQQRLRAELANHWSSHDRAFASPPNAADRVRHLPETTRQAATERVRRVLGGVARPEFLDLMNALTAQAQSDAIAGNVSIIAALEGVRDLIQNWSEALPPQTNLPTKDAAYAVALRVALQERLKAIAPTLAGRISQCLAVWATQSLGPGRTGAPTCLDVLSTLPSRAASLIHDEVQCVLAETQVGPWILPALGDARHAILCWRDFLTQSEPLALAAGGERRLTLIAPPSPANDILCEMLETAFSEPTAVVAHASPVVWLLQEAQNIPLACFAEDLLAHLDLVKEAASRLHTRIDVAWSDALGA